MIDPRSELANPATTPERLAQIAGEHPELGAEIAAHPNVYPDLLEWIALYAMPAPQPAQPEQPAPHDPGQPTTQLPDPGFAQPTTQLPQQDFAQPTTQLPQQDFAQPTTQLPQQPLGGGYQQDPAQQATAQQPYAAAQQPYAQAPEQKPRSKKTLIIVLASVLALLLATGGGVWWFLASKLGGSGSPEAAAVKLVNGIASQDMLALYGSLAPSEFKPFEEPLKTLTKTSTNDSSVSADEALSKLRGAVNIKVAGIQTDTEEIAEGVARVAFTEGTITFDGDADEVASIFAELVAAYAPDMSRDDISDLEQDMAASLELPYVIDFADLRQDMRDSGIDGEGLSLISVNEPGGWYVSPLMTGADYMYLASSQYSDYELGSKVIEGKPSKSPEEAAEALANAVVEPDGDRFDEIAAHLPLPERRLVSIYGYGVVDPFRYADDLKVYEQSYSSEPSGDTARLTIDRLKVGEEWESQGFDLFTGVTIKGLCVTWTDERVTDESDSYLYEDWEVTDYGDKACLTDMPLADELDLDKLGVVAVKEGGGWYVSPIATVADAAAIVSARLTELSESGQLEGLLEDAYLY